MGYFPSNEDFVRCLHWLGRWKIWSFKFFSWENKESWSLQSSGRVIPMQHSNKRSLSSISTFIKSLKHKNPTKLHKLKSIMAQVAKFSQLETATVTIFTQKKTSKPKSPPSIIQWLYNFSSWWLHLNASHKAEKKKVFLISNLLEQKRFFN